MKNVDQKKRISLKERRKRIISLFRWMVTDFLIEKTQRQILGKGWVEKRKVERNRRRARRFVETALELGGVLIKLGQYMSARFDLLPEEWLEELSKLQDSVPAVDFAELRPIIEQDFNDKLENLFLEFNQSPLASASLGQVHEARLLDGTRVAVKVQRPGINAIIGADLEAMKQVIEFLRRRTDLGKLADLGGIYQEFDRTLRRELDYIQEGKSAERIKQNLQRLRYVYVPKIYWERTSGRVITSEFIDAIKISNFEAIDAAGIDRYKTARILANCYLNQLLIDGFFHADPHPGNLFVRKMPDGEVQVAFVDFGMIGEITLENRVQLRKMVYAVVARDVEGVVQAFDALRFIKSPQDVDKVRIAISYFMDKVVGQSLGELRKMDYKEVFEELSHIIYSQPLYLPGDFSFLSRATETLIGLCTSLSPKLNLLQEAKPFIERLATEEVTRATGLGDGSLTGLLNSPIAAQLQTSAIQLINLPRNLSAALEKIESGRLQVQFQSAEVKQAAERVERSNRMVVSSVMASSLFISGVILITASAPLWATVLCLGGAGALMLQTFFGK
jgi:predicted unusual protein kinase regulating ubiquinone biosynthesis (AarF/ABC1/UbiB family)